jgi:hypothetical protein
MNQASSKKPYRNKVGGFPPQSSASRESEIMQQLSQAMSAPGAVSQAMLSVAHSPTSTVLPVMELVHRLLAAALSIALVLGTADLIAPAPVHALFVGVRSGIDDDGHMLADMYDAASHVGSASSLQVIANAGNGEFAAAALPNLSGIFASLGNDISGTIAAVASTLHMPVNNTGIPLSSTATASQSDTALSEDQRGKGDGLTASPAVSISRAGAKTRLVAAATSAPSSRLSISPVKGSDNSPSLTVPQQATQIQQADLSNYVTEQSLATQLSDFESYMSRQFVPSSLPASPPGTAGGFGTPYSASNNIGSLSGITITNATLSNVSGITPASMPTLQSLSGLLGIGQGGTGTSTAPGANRLMISDGNGNWEYAATSSLGLSAVASLAGLTDVAFTTVAAGNILQYNGTSWTNISTSSLGIAGSNPWSSSGSNIYFNTGSVGIGTATPSSALQVVGTTTSSNITIAGTTSGSGLLSLGGINGSSVFNQEISQSISGNTSTLLFNLNHGSLPGSNEANTIRFNGPNTTIDAVNANDSLGIRFGESFSTGYLGMVNTGGGSNGSVPAGGFLLTMGLSNAGKVGSIVPTTSFSSPVWRNVLDDGSGNMTITGSVGIGTTTPGSLLSLNGIANFTAATSTFYSTGGINLAGGCFAINGTCISGGGAGVGLGANSWTGLQTFTAGFVSQASSTVAGNFTATGFITTNSGYQLGGSMAMYASTTNSSVAVGIGAGTVFPNLSSINNNTAVGYTALYSSSLSGSSNSAFGSGALYGDTTGYSNSAFGASAFNKVTTGTLNTGFGSGVGYGNISGTGNSYFGYNSGQNATTSSYNTGVGYEALYGNAASGGIGNTYNTAIGYQAGFDLTTGADNTFLGQFPTTGVGITSGSNNILIGEDVRAGLSPAGSNQLNIGNLLFASGLGSATALGTGNVGIGTATPWAKLSILGGSSGNLFELDSAASAASTTMATFSSAGLFSIGDDIGYSSGIFSVDASSSTTTISNLSIGNIVFDTDAGVVNLSDLPVDSSAAQGTLESQSINIGGNPLITAYGVSNGTGGLQNYGVGIGTSTTPYAMLQVWGADTSASTPAFLIANNASTTEFIVYDNGSATLAGTLTQNSDERLKTNIVSLDSSSSLDLIDELRPVNYNWIDPTQSTSTQVGFIAQEVQRIFPNLVATTSPTALTPDGTLSVNYIGFIAPIVSAIQELTARVVALETTIANLASLITTHEVDTQKLCVGSVCVTQAQFLAMVQAANQQSSTPTTNTSDTGNSSLSASSTGPIISINGNNPATVTVGTTYADLGATITGPSTDLNLGITASVDGATSSPQAEIQIDTSVAGTHRITYSATDQNGLTGSATRTVNVIAPQVPISSGATSSDATSTDQ